MGYGTWGGGGGGRSVDHRNYLCEHNEVVHYLAHALWH